MGIATVFVIPSNIEPFFWLAIFIVCAYIIAKRAPRWPFLHGLSVSILNSIWITSAHVLLFNQSVATHQAELASMSSMPFANHPRRMMALVGPVTL